FDSGLAVNTLLGLPAIFEGPDRLEAHALRTGLCRMGERMFSMPTLPGISAVVEMGRIGSNFVEH
ncbi:hypothetical protein ACLBSV_30110, partial [Klebsiella pneumoniae]|uniref:hypothetical protein n=1 Tax=Klebsiella pneumoniae TaxID=573 RepID=UPI0039689691